MANCTPRFLDSSCIVSVLIVQESSTEGDVASYCPRFSAECADLEVRVQSAADKAMTVSADVARLEAVEHIPCQASSPAQAHSLAQVQPWL